MTHLFLVVPDERGILNLDVQNFLDMVPNLLSFVLLALLLTYLLYKPVKKILQARADRVEGDMNDAALSKASAAELKVQYEKKVREIESERAAILEEARKTASENRDKIIETAKAEATDLKARAARDIESEKEQFKGAVHQAIVDISADMAAKLIAVTVDTKTHEKLFAEALTELEATSAFRTESAIA